MEVWKDIEGYEGLYQVNNLGRIKTLKRFVRHSSGGIRTVTEKILNGSYDNDGYLRVTLTKNRIMKGFLIHRLVAFSFLNNIENKPTINHKNGIKNDNRLDNIEWSTCLENLQHAVKNGLKDHKGEKHPLNKLTKQEVLEIRSNLHKGKTQKNIGQIYQVKEATIQAILKNRIWKHI